MNEKKFKLRFYQLDGYEKGNLDHEEFFETREEMDDRYYDVFERDLYALNPTAWEKKDELWIRIYG